MSINVYLSRRIGNILLKGFIDCGVRGCTILQFDWLTKIASSLFTSNDKNKKTKQIKLRYI